MTQLIMSLTAIDQDLALIRRLSVAHQLSRSIQTLDRVCGPTLPKQQQAVLRSCDDAQLAQRSTTGELLSVHQ